MLNRSGTPVPNRLPPQRFLRTLDRLQSTTVDLNADLVTFGSAENAQVDGILTALHTDESRH